MQSITIDRSKPLREESNTGHNRWHPDISPVVEVDEGEEVVMETRDAFDGQMRPGVTEADFGGMDAGVIHPLTGPVAVKGAEPGDLLEVEFVDIQPQPYAFSVIFPGFGFLRDVFTDPFMVHWNIADGFATSEQIPGVRVLGASFMGVSGVAPSQAQLEAWTRREAELAERGGVALPPDVGGAVPISGVGATHGVRTLPPRENGGNFDVKQLSTGSKLLLPVAVDGALFSTGDAHFAQGDGEVCVTAVEMGATCTVRFRVLKGEAERHNIRWPRFSREDYYIAPEWAAPRRFRSHHGHAGYRRWGQRGGEPDAGVPQRHPEHDRSVAGTGVQPQPGLRDMQRRGGPEGEQRGGCAQLRSVGVFAGGFVCRVKRNHYD